MKIGVAGLGFMGATHLPAFAKLPGVAVTAACSSGSRELSGDLSQVGGNLNRPAASFDFSKVRKYPGWPDLIADPNLDAIDICLPSDLHAEVATAALAAGKHVLCEKPMALTAADCDRMNDAARRSGRVLMIAHVLRFWPEYRRLREFVETREQGEILSATFIRRCGIPDWSRWLTDEARSGGAVIDLLVHDIDQALLLFGMPERVAAKQLGELDAVSAVLLYPNGPEVRIQGGWFAAATPFSMSFQVRAARAEIEFSSQGLTMSDSSGRRTVLDAQGPDGYDAEIGYFVDCCRTNSQPDLCPPRQSAAAVKLALLLKQSRSAGGQQLKCSD